MNFAAQPTTQSLRGPGGKACANCARVKSKCVARLDGASCERCHRLNKPCVPSAPAKRRGPKPSTAVRSNPMSTRLEKKLDDLMSLMKVQQTPVDLTRDSSGHREPDNVDDYGSENSPTLTDNASVGLQNDLCVDEPTIPEAEARLRCFREQMLPSCPYVRIPLEMEAATLRQQYPFLWLTIMSVTSVSCKSRQSQGSQVKKIIVDKIVAGGERSVDMLLGVLTFLCWVHLFPMDKLFASMASQIALCMVYDIGLHLPPPEQLSKVGQLLKCKGFGLLPQARKERTMEDRRALLGTYVITSTTCHAFRSADGLPWSSYLDECIKYIDQNSAESLDHVLVAQARLQLMINQLRSIYRGGSNAQVPPAYVDVLRSQIEYLLTPVGGVNSVFENNAWMMRLYHFTILLIHESLIVKTTPSHDQELKRFQVYQRVVDSIRSWFDLYFSIPWDHLPFLPCSNYSQLYYVTMFVYRITALKLPVWDSLLNEASVKLMPTLDKVIHKFEEASSRVPGEADEAFLFGIQKFSALRTVWQSESTSELDRGDSLPPLQEDAMMVVSGADFSPFPMDPTTFQMMPGIFDDLAWQ